MSSEIKNRTVNSPDDISLKEAMLKINEWIKFLLSKWLIILIFVVIGACVGATYAWFKKPVYTATTTFVLEEGGSAPAGLGNLGGIASMVGIEVGSSGGIFQGDNILELYRSRQMIQDALLTPIEYDGNKHLLVDRYIDFNDLRSNWVKSTYLKNLSLSPREADLKFPQIVRLKDSILGVIVADINKNYLFVSKPDKKLGIIKVDVKSNDEVFAKEFNNQIVKTVNNFYKQTKTKKSLENVAILKEKSDSVRAVMNGAIYASAEVSDATPNLNLTKLRQRNAPMQSSQFNAETNKAVLGELVKNLELTRMSLLKETPLIQVIDMPVFPLQKDKLGKLKALLVGGIIAGFLIIVILLSSKIIKSIKA